MATIRKGNSLNNTAERYQNKMLDDVGEVLRSSLRTEEFQPLQDNSDNQQKASLSTAYPRKVHGYGEKRIRMDFSRRPLPFGTTLFPNGATFLSKKGTKKYKYLKINKQTSPVSQNRETESH